jgi:deoxyribodipyrimidine photo-lyase
MSVNSHRTQKLSINSYKGGVVVYQMCREMRVHDNDALFFAQQLAIEKGEQLIVNYVIWNYEWEGATRRFYDWVLPSLAEVEKELRKYSIPLSITFEEKKLFKHTINLPKVDHLGAVVIEEIPLHFMRHWKKLFLLNYSDIPLYEVDAHNCIPVWKTSSKQEFGARTIRKKIHTQLAEFLEEYDKIIVHDANKKILNVVPLINWEYVSKKISCRESVAGVGVFTPGEKSANSALEHFLQKKLFLYESERNKIEKDGQSNLSPYLSHGNISRRRIILELLRIHSTTLEQVLNPVSVFINEKQKSITSFIEECVVRAELAENFCYYNRHYSSAEGFPLWARETLKKASEDKREYVYTREEFETACTHDRLWNAAQNQMVKTGKMQGYMRMYWAKKILEWSKNSSEAMSIAVYLNDTYELDGRDPNGYVGCAWSIGGLHDRPWFRRAVFGMVRYMASSGVMKKGNIQEYQNRWAPDKSKLIRPA